MSQEIYHKLARRLDAIPNGFPATESGVELELLAKIFTPEQAALASVMQLTLEPAEAIGPRVGLDARTAYLALKEMARQGLIRAGRGERRLAFGLMPFVVGIYEEQLSRMDSELAELFERYFQASRGGVIVREAPPVHRVIPVEEAIPVGVEILPHEQASALLKGAKSWGVRDCICRVQKRLVGQGCDHPVENCLVFAPVEGAFDHAEATRAITQEEALCILHDAEAAGLVHSPGNFRDDHFYICNCCTCSCGILRSVAEFGAASAIAPSAFYVVADDETCVACGDCVARCQFGALSVFESACQVDLARCVGCGLCVTVCPSDALRLERRPEDEVLPPPTDLQDWMARRARARGIAIP